MNITYQPLPIGKLPLAMEVASNEFVKATAFLLIPLELLYFSIYFHTKGVYKVYRILNFLAITAFWLAPFAAPIACGPVRCLQYFAIAIGTMKALDIWARRHSMPAYTAGSRPPEWRLALLLLTELRYESFTPNHIRVPKNQENFSEPLQLGIHVAIFVVLQTLPQNLPTVLAFEVMLAIYIIWTSLQLLLRYKSSPALFGPLYMIDSFTGFWSETWHNAFASPCTSLAYAPLRYGLPGYGIPVIVARSLGVLGAFGLMAIFHMYALSPILSREGLIRIGAFFMLNGVATVSEAALWGHKKHWLKAALAWTCETILASWTASGLNIPNGLSRIPWRELCDAPSY
ncbi:hypothetical protein V8E51_000607 [Hyaloscypha variabilis]|uniref:Wax synthase domain-containing protein n=1 Tax=Hyaloscypha variabilis (strain UAMH 11265 / GT02V1 / F) TaxID=1149755 RepID=A0A2J6RNL1_HYAVF|nr:hypothetical protein L207DRAFT_39140 [Hyaloscypha variabilis F]